MSNLRVIKKRNQYVILDYNNGRKQVKHDGKTLSFQFKKEAKAYRDKLSGAVERKEIILSGRHNFKEKFKEYGLFRLEMAHSLTSRDTVHGVSGYISYFNKFIVPHFPDVYLDEVDGPMLEEFVKALVAAKVPHKTNTRIIQHIHTFLRWCEFKKLHHNFASA